MFHSNDYYQQFGDSSKSLDGHLFIISYDFVEVTRRSPIHRSSNWTFQSRRDVAMKRTVSSNKIHLVPNTYFPTHSINKKFLLFVRQMLSTRLLYLACYSLVTVENRQTQKIANIFPRNYRPRKYSKLHIPDVRCVLRSGQKTATVFSFFPPTPLFISAIIPLFRGILPVPIEIVVASVNRVFLRRRRL